MLKKSGTIDSMTKILDLITEEMEQAFADAGYEKELARVTLSNRPDLCEYQCNGAMAAAKQYKMAPFQIAEKVVEAVKENKPVLVTATALMTTTMTAFGKIIALMQEAGLDTPFGCGGGAVRRDFVEESPQTFYGVEAYHVPKLADAIVDDGKTWEDIRNEYSDIVGEYVAAYS